ncbi:hypothetical protein B0T25DRAFT_626902 [Lasiosphaeria hispida]|uniref:Uncharacterized protein n=1 Tax=Lasiosphaeria hispida TaxID=260671 RepID=A0AAJ0HTN5_9PEZI|nr:hypothetical protein B0T25DRAFT_626902 [Lasiosphaeria hispida]
MNALPEPDVIAGALDTLRVQSQRIANVGAIQNQQNILAAVQALGQQVHVMQQQMNQRFDTLENRQSNFEIAAVNARLVHADGAAILQRPVNIHNGGDIPDFPLTQPQLYTINDATADAILLALGIHLAPNTPLAIKRESIARKWILK